MFMTDGTKIETIEHLKEVLTERYRMDSELKRIGGKLNTAQSPGIHESKTTEPDMDEPIVQNRVRFVNMSSNNSY